MLQELAGESENQGLKINNSKTKVLRENDAPIDVNNIQIENVESYIYMGQSYSTREKKTKTGRLKTEARLDAQHSPSTATSSKSNIGTCLKRQVYNTYVLPAMTYGAETWALTRTKNKLAAAQTKMKRSMLNTTHQDAKVNFWVREKIKVTDVTEHVRRRKWT